MKDYWIEKLNEEYKRLEELWNTVLKNWKGEDEDLENIYRIRVPLNITCFLCRRLMEQTYIANKENKGYKNPFKEIRVRILKDGCPKNAFYKDVEFMQYFDSFKDKIESKVDLYEVCNYIIHESGSSYADDMISYKEDGTKLMKDIKETSIYYNVETFNLRKRFNENKFISWFVRFGSEKDGNIMIDIKSLIKNLNKFINIYQK